jgi:hypothetical protein
MTSRGIGPGLRSQRIDGTRPERSANSPEPRAKGSAWNRFKTDLKISLVKNVYSDLRTPSARGKAVRSDGLYGLAGGKLSASLGANAVLEQLLDCRANGNAWKKALYEMEDIELLQTYKNVKHNSAVLSAIEQTHGNPSALHDFAKEVADAITQAVRDKGMRADDIVPKPFDPFDKKDEELVGALCRDLFRPLLTDPELSAEGLLDQIIVLHKSNSDVWLTWLPELSNEELRQICNTIARSSSLLSAIRHGYGHPSKFDDFAHGFALVFKTEAERRKLHIPDMEPKALEPDDPKDHNLVRTVLARDAALALADARALPSAAKDSPKPVPGRVLDLFEQHFAVCSSVEFWSQNDAWRSYEPLGLAASIALLRQLSARLDAGGKITSEDIAMLKRLLRDDRSPSEAYAAKASTIHLGDNQKETLFQMSKLVAEYYIEPREIPDPITGDTNIDLLLNLQGPARQNAENGVSDALAAKNPGAGAAKLLATLEQAFTDYVHISSFDRFAVIERFTTMAEPEPPLIFHP